jgi:hypothetical protein
MKTLAATLTAAAALLAAASAANAGIDIHWVVSGTFDDGGSLAGSFDIDQYGFITDWDITTSTLDYLRQPSPGVFESGGNTSHSITVGPDYQDYLLLSFVGALTALSNDNELKVSDGTSFECIGSFNCPVTNDPAHTRFLTSGSAAGTQTSIAGGPGGGNGNPTVPEPATWALMIAGFGFAGAALRRRRATLSV